MKNRFTIIMSSMVVLLVMLLILGGCGQQSATPSPATSAKPKDYQIYCAIDLSGPSATADAPVPAASADYEKWYNAQGGLDGVPIHFNWYDTKFERAIAVSSYVKIREMTPKPAIVGIAQGPDVDALASRFAEDKITNICSSISQNAAWPPGWAFCTSNYIADLSGGVFSWLSKEWAKSGQTGKLRLALLNPKNAYGIAAAAPEAVEYLNSLGNIEIVYNDFFDPASLDLSSDILRMMQNKPDWIYGYYYASWGAAFYKSIDAAGYTGKVKVATCGWSVMSQMAQQTGPALLEGVVGAFHIPPWLPSDQKQVSGGMEWVTKLFDDNKRPKEWRNPGYSGTLPSLVLVTNMLEAAIKKAGWAKFDGQTVYDIIRNTSSSDLKVITWGVSPGQRTNNKYEMFKFQNSIPMPITDWLTTPDIRPAVYRTTEYGWSAAGWPQGAFKK